MEIRGSKLNKKEFIILTTLTGLLNFWEEFQVTVRREQKLMKRFLRLLLENNPLNLITSQHSKTPNSDPQRDNWYPWRAEEKARDKLRRLLRCKTLRFRSNRSPRKSPRRRRMLWWSHRAVRIQVDFNWWEKKASLRIKNFSLICWKNNRNQCSLKRYRVKRKLTPRTINGKNSRLGK